VFSITLQTPQGQHQFDCPPDQFILDVAESKGLKLPGVCRGGACSSCVARQLSGAIPDQSEQTYLSAEDVERGYVLLCVAYPTGDCQFLTHQSEAYLAEVAASNQESELAL
jgi:ferredoxin